MIGTFETKARQCPDRTCFTYVDRTGSETSFTYRQLRMTAAAMAQCLQRAGVRRGDCVVVDLPNVPEYPLVILAAAYGNFTLVTLNNRLTAAEKLTRTIELEARRDIQVSYRIDQERIGELVQKAKALVAGDREPVKVGVSQSGRMARVTAARSQGQTRNSLRFRTRSPQPEEPQRRRSMYPHDAEESVIHFAERAGHVFDPSARALIMFTSGTTGKHKAVPLTWNNLIGSADVANATISGRGAGVWQAVLPLYHIGGFQVVLRSLCNGTPFVLYEKFNAARLLADVDRFGATHVSVVDKMLQDMLVAGNDAALTRYRCILVGGGASNPKTLERSLNVGARAFMSYGMTETSSMIASAQVTRSFTGGMRLLPGYEARIVDPGADGFGRLAVKGPGVFGGYLNARAAHTVDGFFLTGDTAALHSGLLFVKERTDDMFVSGGENVYPAEILDTLLRIPGVSDAYVFGAPDPTWGRRPVAFVERDRTASLEPTVQFATMVRQHVAPRLSKLYLPKHICVVNELPRTGIGKTDRATIEACYEQRIEVVRVTLHHVRIPFTQPFKTPKGTLYERESIIVEVTDHAGRTGLGECVSFPTDWYLPETLPQDAQALQRVLAPKVINEVYLHPSEVSASFAADPQAAAFPMACGALEPALWDLYGKIAHRPLWQLIGGSAANGEAAGGSNGSASSAGLHDSSITGTREAVVNVAAGAVVGLGSVAETVEAVRKCVQSGYRRVKLKVAPGSAHACVQAVRREFPQLMITLDANQSFTEADLAELQAIDTLGALWIEEPLDPARGPKVGSSDLFQRLARLQRSIATPICLDESFSTMSDLSRALAHPELRCVAVKIGKFGGVKPALDFVRAATAQGIQVWMGGMYDTGVSKRLHAAFQTLPGVTVPGDIGSVTRYFASDISAPPHTSERGLVTLNRAGHTYGLGCRLDEAALNGVLVNRVVIE